MNFSHIYTLIDSNLSDSVLFYLTKSEAFDDIIRRLSSAGITGREAQGKAVEILENGLVRYIREDSAVYVPLSHPRNCLSRPDCHCIIYAGYAPGSADDCNPD